MSEPGTVTPAAPAVVAAWHAGLDSDTLGHVQSRGWDKLAGDAAALEAVKAHREAQKLIGRPAESLVVWPKDATDQEAWGKVREKMGVPKEAKDYAFDGVKFADGTELDAPFIEAIRATAAKNYLTPDVAKSIAADVVKMIEGGEATETAEYESKLNAEREALKANWGAGNYANNLLLAKNAAEKLGVDAEALSVLEKTVGYSKVIEMFRKMGATMGEDKFIRSAAPGGGALTKEEAGLRLKELREDKEWGKRYFAGDVNAKREFENLTAVAAQ